MSLHYYCTGVTKKQVTPEFHKLFYLNVMNDEQPQVKHRMFAVPVLVVVLITLFFGLKSERWHVDNNIRCLPGSNTLQIRNPGMAYVDEVHSLKNIGPKDDFTIHVGLTPNASRRSGFRPILMLHDGDDHLQLALWQWKASVIVMNGNDYDHTRKWPRLTAVDALHEGEISLISITVGDHGSRLLVNGLPAGAGEDWRLSIPAGVGKLRLVLGNSVYGRNGWDGDLHGVAFYSREFPPAAVGNYYDAWLREDRFPAQPDSDLLLLYTFDDGEGQLILDRSGHNQPLLLPGTPVQFKREFLSFPSHGFRANRSLFVDIAINLIGFMPLGVVLCLWLHQSPAIPGKYLISTVVIFSFALSLGIEISQAWLPDRSSSLLDLCLNTAGAWLGAILFTCRATSLQ